MKKFLMMAGILASLVTGASASVEVRIINAAGGGDTGWIQCADPSCTFLGAVGNYFLTLDSAVKTDGVNPFLDMTYGAHTTVANAGTIVIEAMANGYTSFATGFNLVANGNSTLGDSDTIVAYQSNTNAFCAAGVNACVPTTAIVTTPSFTPNPGYSQTGSGGSSTVNPYSLGLAITISNPTAAGANTGDIMLDAVPEPASVLLLGTLLVGVTQLVRRRVKA